MLGVWWLWGFALAFAVVAGEEALLAFPRLANARRGIAAAAAAGVALAAALALQ